MSHFNVSLIVRAKSQDSVHKPQFFFLKRKESRSGSNRGPSAYQPSALPLGHTGSQRGEVGVWVLISYHLLATLSPPEWLCIKVGSCASHFNVSLTVWAKSQNNVHKPNFLKRKESRSGSNRGPSAYPPSALPLGHTGSRNYVWRGVLLVTV